MNKQVLTACVAAMAGILVSGCAQVPDVESRLQTLRFHPNMYVVQAGDTIDSIAHRYQLTPSQLAGLNRHTGGGISPGDRINVRPGTELSTDVRDRSGSGWLRSSSSRSTRPANEARRRAATQYPAPAPSAAQQQVAQASAIVNGQESIVTSEFPAAKYSAPEYLAPVMPSMGGGSAGMREEIIADDYVESRGAAQQGMQPVVRQSEELQQSLTGNVSGQWYWPAAGEVAREYAPSEVNGQGVDIAGVPGQEILAAANGTVIYTGRDLSNSGNLVILRHDNNLLSTYSHAKDLFVAEDDFVKGGDPIASLGWNAARESVLHFEVRKEGKPVDPMRYLPAR